MCANRRAWWNFALQAPRLSRWLQQMEWFHSVSTQRCVGVRMLQTHRTFCGKAARDSAFVLKMNNCVSLLNTQPNGRSTEFFTETLLLAS